MYKNALKEDFIRVVEKLNGTVENTDTIVKLKTKIENSSTFKSDPDFVKTLIQNCIDERVSRNKREVTSGKQKIELAKLELAQLEKEVELQRVKNKALSLNPAAKFEEKQFKTLNKETATHIGIREAEDWFRPIDLAKECDIYISSRSGSHKEIPITYGYTQDPIKIDHKTLNQKIKENYPQYLEREKKIAIYAVIHLITQETVNNQIDDWLRQGIIKESVFDYCSDIVLCKKANGAMKTSSVEFISRSPNPLPMKNSPLVSMEIPLRTAYGQAGRCGMQPKSRQSSRAGASK
ncbi:hypothetical protein TNCV_4941921 [Trichonephila clavipes]|nr:hypothetical protein TNCV_4941921 [Trichonephila clavipes]